MTWVMAVDQQEAPELRGGAGRPWGCGRVHLGEEAMKQLPVSGS